MNPFESTLAARLEALKGEGLYRELRWLDSAQTPQVLVNGRGCVNFSSNDYLGLANDPMLVEAMKRSVDRYGVGAGASRLICGSMEPHRDLEQALARFKGTEAALSFSTGYAAAVGTLGALLTKGDIVIVDKLVHACLIDGAKLSGATLRAYHHNDMEDLERILKWSQAEREKVAASDPSKPPPQVLVITESVFSMDGDLAPLRNVVELKDKYGAWLMVDEAHATGLFGENRSGLIEAMSLEGQVEVQMGTLGKALGTSGGYVAGARALIEFLINRARSFIFSTAPPPSTAAAAAEAVRWVQTSAGEMRRQEAWARVNRMKEEVISAGWALAPVQSAILPLVVGEESDAMSLAAELLEAGFLIPAIRYPTVARGKARLRLTLTAIHPFEAIEQLGSRLKLARHRSSALA